MRAFILSAGLGTRLRPLTDHAPKPLVTVAGRPMVSYVLDLLEHYGFTEVLMNIHYLPDLMEKFVREENARRKKIKIFLQDERSKILGSGGALVKAAPWLFAQTDMALALNADTLLQANLKDLLQQHKANHKKFGALCTLAVMPHAEAGIRYTGLTVDENKVQEFISPKNKQSSSQNLFHFPGAYVLSKEALPFMPQEERDFSIVDELWKPLAKEGKLGAWLYTGNYQDLGTPADLQLAEERILKGEFSLDAARC